MIVFKKIRWKNFLKTGNYFNEMDLNVNPITLIYGKNGAGKSTINEAIIFGLFGKSYRGINKNQLINSINQKELVVEIEFSLNGKEYKVTRGIKPNIFEIYEDEKLIDLDSTTKDYQEKLNQILGVNQTVFTQTVVIGSTSYTPFMKLPSGQRRQFVESVLDLDIFSEMSKLAKDELTAFDDNIQCILSDVSKNQTIINELNKSISTIQTNSQDRIDGIQLKINETKSEVVELSDGIKELKTLISENSSKLSELEDYVTQGNSIRGAMESIVNDIKYKAALIKRISAEDKCPTCGHDIDESERSSKVNNLKTELEPLVIKRTELVERLESLQENLNRYSSIKETIQQLDSSVQEKMRILTLHARHIKTLEESILEFNSGGDVSELLKSVSEYQETVDRLNKEKDDIRDSIRLYKFIVNILKDDGAKREIINQYIPLFNKIVNEHLAHFEFYVEFELDEEFNETIKSRYRDSFSYYNFSEGERSRIDSAILFAWRRIAQMKNSFDTNLMLCDELWDSSMDEDGNNKITELLLKYCSNAIIISHNSNMNELISEAIEFYDDGGFSYMKQGER